MAMLREFSWDCMLRFFEVSCSEDDVATSAPHPGITGPQRAQVIGEIRIGEGDNVSARGQHACPDCGALSRLARHVQRGETAPESGSQFPCPIGASVIDNKDAVIDTPFLKKCLQVSKGAGKPLFFIVSRNHNGQIMGDV
ncbi:MAG: hypothetical protein U0903_06105 [Planctomycetales bacterium]